MKRFCQKRAAANAANAFLRLQAICTRNILFKVKQIAQNVKKIPGKRKLRIFDQNIGENE